MLSTLTEPLEQRRHFSLTATGPALDASQWASEAKGVRVVLMKGQQTESGDRRAISADLRVAGGRTNARLAARLTRDDAAGWARVFAAEAALVAKGSALVNRSVADGVLLLKRPGSAAFQSRVSADEAALGSQVAALLSAVQDQYVAAEQTRNADLSAITAANPSAAALPGHVQAVQNDEAATSALLGATVALVQSDANRLATDLAGIGG